METRAHHVLIGLFTVLAVGGALLFALWLGKSSMDREYNYYEISFNRAVSGLSNGSSVEYSGIKVGDVETLWLEPDDPRKVRARIRVYSGTPIKQDTRARLALANITGSMTATARNSPRQPSRGSNHCTGKVEASMPSEPVISIQELARSCAPAEKW